MKALIPTLLITVWFTAVLCDRPAFIKIEQGELQGVYLKSAGGRKYAAYQGIPYAHPPVGKYRFKDPVPAEPWIGIWNASQPGSACLQFDYIPGYKPQEQNVRGSENCLFVNIYVPQLWPNSEFQVSSCVGHEDFFVRMLTSGIQNIVNSSWHFYNMGMSLPTNKESPLDVVVYIHGGAFMYGQSDIYGPKLIMDRDVIYVTFNYRVGPLGFLTTEDDVVPGNMGLKDQSLALQWIQDNIAAFGGNPNSVTLTGNSAGGASVHYHLLSPMSKGLFHRGYSLSGSALCPWTLMENGLEKAKKLAAALGCETQSTKQMVKCLRHRPAWQIVQQVENFKTWLMYPFSPFGPTVETSGPNPFITQHPVDIILERKAQDLPWIASVTEDEGVYPIADFIAVPDYVKEVEQRFPELLPHILDYNYTVPKDKHEEVADKIRQFYLKGEAFSERAAKQVIKMASDRLFILDVERAARLHATANKAPVYFYMFSYRGKHSLSEFMSGSSENYGVAHCDDTCYALKCSFTNTEETEEDRKMSNLMLDLWANYAIKGNPSPKSDIDWTPIPAEVEAIPYLHIEDVNKVEMRTSDDLGNRKFWDALPIKEYHHKITNAKYEHSEL